MLPLELIVQEDLDAASGHAVDVALVAAVHRGERPAVLRVFSFGDPTIVLGRYHLVPPAAPAARAHLHRRLSGGRVGALGPGFAAVALVLPHRSALAAREPLALRPEQALNRFARGLVVGLRGLGVDAFYPGRDVLTVDQRRLGLVSLACEASGVAIFEALLAVDGDWAALATWTESVDPEGVIAAERLTADHVTALARHVARSPSLTELAHCLGDAYAKEFGTTTVPAESAAASGSASTDAWLDERRRRPDLDRHGVTWGQLGVFEAYLRRDGAGAIADLLLAGDFIADSPAIAELEARLRGCPAEVGAIDAVVRPLFADARHFLLGVEAHGVVAATIAGAR